MKALFIRCYGRLNADMLVGGLIDMGVPPVYLASKFKEAGADVDFIEKANAKAQFSAHYFHIPDGEHEELLLKQNDILDMWNELCDTSGVPWKMKGWTVISTLCAGASNAIDEIDGNIIDLRRGGVREEDILSLYAFLAGIEYLDIEAIFTCPFELGRGKSEAERMTEKILVGAGSTAGAPIPSADIHPFAAAIMEGLSKDFVPMDGAFLADRTAYGSESSEAPDGGNTVALYLGYYTEPQESIFKKQMKVFGTQADILF